jgi:hypothetical protein
LIKAGFRSGRVDEVDKFRIPPVDREHPPGALALRYSDQRRVGQVHRQVAVFQHQLAHARATVATELDHQLNFGYTQHVPQLVLRLCGSAAGTSLRSTPADCAKRISNAGQRFAAVPMMRVAPVNQRDKRAGVNQYTEHAFPR